MSEHAQETQKNTVTGLPASKLAGADFITGVLLALFGGAFLTGALNMRVYQNFLISPGFFPAILGVLFILFGIFLAYTSSLRGGCADALRVLSPASLKKSFTSPVFKKGGVVFLLILSYVALLGTTDFVYLSIAYLLLTFFFLKAARWYWIISIAIAAPVIVQYVFTQIFRIPMP
ncbi:MAG: tripartite tricarboxylate transporter TctB family protein [Synergistaceae bacterium]|nr:tripartite tricarboxylate transporter TctB family protein [Synergistaceae bacterium]